MASAMLLWSACAHQAASPSVAPKPVGLQIMIDTGRMVTGHRDFSRYDTPGKCRDAVETTRDALWRDTERDTLRYSPETDTLPTAAVQVGLKCRNRFTIDETEPRELGNMVMLLLMVNQDDRARVAVERRLQLAKSVEEQGTILSETLQAYMNAQPMRKTEALSTLRRLDALGSPVLGLRVTGHATIEQDALQRFDTLEIRQEAETIIADGQQMTPQDRDNWLPALRMAYMGLVALTWYERPSDIPAVYSRAQADLGPLRNGTGAFSFFGGQPFRINLIVRQILAMLGQQTPPLEARFWFGAGADTVRPAAGKVSLLVRVEKDCGQGCYPLYTALRRLNAKYASQGLEITLMAKTVGFSPGSAPQLPATEAATARDYFLDTLKLPFTLAVAQTPFTRRPDGRRVNERVQFERAYLGSQMVIADRAGNTVMLANNFNEAELDAFIHRAVGTAALSEQRRQRR